MSLLALVGPTASGKTEAAIRIAPQLGAEIVSVDSMLVYRGMDVGTAKPTPEQRRLVPHHLLDLAEPDADFSVARFQDAARRTLRDMETRGVRALLVGGSGLYFRAVVDDLSLPGTDPSTREELEREAALVGAGPLHRRLAASDPLAAERIQPKNLRRTVRALEVAAVTGRPFSSFAEQWGRYPADRVRAAGIVIPAAILRERIERRVEAMFSDGLLEEAARLSARGLSDSPTAGQAIGYAEAVGHLRGTMSLEEAVSTTVRRTRALARRQMAWFRRDPRITWFESGIEGGAGVADDVARYLQGD